MKKEKINLVLIITMVVALIATIAAVAYAFVFKQDMPLETQGAANSLWGIAYWIVFIFAVCAIIGIIVFLIKQMIEDKAKLVMIILGLTIVALFVSYFLASGTDISQATFEKAGANYSVSSSKWIGAACYTVYFLFAGVICSVIYSEISKRLK
ncbi:MAG: hypothetical protein IJ213_09195 [Bacteroidales bacterium]|nr:hypothetical protein [Bacteroidales bacterium]MBQ9313200.1 hypothetical protein [Bacteroidales bacterium]